MAIGKGKKATGKKGRFEKGVISQQKTKCWICQQNQGSVWCRCQKTVEGFEGGNLVLLSDYQKVAEERDLWKEQLQKNLEGISLDEILGKNLRLKEEVKSLKRKLEEEEKKKDEGLAQYLVMLGQRDALRSEMEMNEEVERATNVFNFELGADQPDPLDQLQKLRESKAKCKRKIQEAGMKLLQVIEGFEKNEGVDVLWEMMLIQKEKVALKISKWKNPIWKEIAKKVNSEVVEYEKSDECAKSGWLTTVFGNLSRQQMRVLRKMVGRKYVGQRKGGETKGKDVWKRSTVGDTGVYVSRMAPERNWMKARDDILQKWGFENSANVIRCGSKGEMRPIVENIRRRTKLFLETPHLRKKWEWIEKDGVKHVVLGIFGDGAPQSKRTTMTNIGLRFVNFRSESPKLLMWLFGGDVTESDEDVALFYHRCNEAIKILEKETMTVKGEEFSFHFFPVGDLKMLQWLAGLVLF
jgi:hypothetical protein